MSSPGAAGVMLSDSSPVESEFLARETLVEVSPKFSHPKLKFISGEFGPFDPMLTVHIPLWLAVTLQKKEKCRIVIPDWLQLENLQQCVETEKSSTDFVKMPPYYQEVAAILFDCCREDIENADRVHGLLQDLENIRADRLKLGMQSVAKTTFSGKYINSIQLNNISSMEIVSIKRFFLKSLETFEGLVPGQQSRTDNMAPSGAYDQSAVGGGRKLRKHRK